MSDTRIPQELLDRVAAELGGDRLITELRRDRLTTIATNDRLVHDRMMTIALGGPAVVVPHGDGFAVTYRLRDAFDSIALQARATTIALLELEEAFKHFPRVRRHPHSNGWRCYVRRLKAAGMPVPSRRTGQPSTRAMRRAAVHALRQQVEHDILFGRQR